MTRRTARLTTGISLLVILVLGVVALVTPLAGRGNRNTFVAYFANTNGLYAGDEIRILGVAVGTVEAIEQAARAMRGGG